jgi:hypothetical protein
MAINFHKLISGLDLSDKMELSIRMSGISEISFTIRDYGKTDELVIYEMEIIPTFRLDRIILPDEYLKSQLLKLKDRIEQRRKELRIR